ncbi:MAG: L-2-amino-thiazoline-4-carboxylic acid hydrolase [Candidatus Bathyarchaeota archaeon]|nr:MAG: L-2-amino-thiazoline-4-carboxylic acid hydrolase [Candidatus Bathyarchaeota archaeon]
MGVADIGYLWNCKPDFALVQAMNPKLKMRRTKTLVRGDDCCDFIHTWEDI